ncbi:MAG: putative NADPH-dependent reductase [Dactylosporangium sp.]|nr:putative NADPH-dependent reductase [Dactylosporangium sp.]
MVVSGNPRPHSRTLHLAEEVGAALAGRLGQALPQLVDVAVLGSRLLVSGDGDLLGAVDRLQAATLLVVATPTYKGTYTGVLKVLLDALPANGLSGAVAVTVVTAGAPAQAAAVDGHLRELLGELGATVVSSGLVALEGQLDRPGDLATGYAARVAPELTLSAPARSGQPGR